MPSVSLLPSQIELECNKERALLTSNPRPSTSKEVLQGCAPPFKSQPKVWEILSEDACISHGDRAGAWRVAAAASQDLWGMVQTTATLPSSRERAMRSQEKERTG